MIRNIHIERYKSVETLDLQLGRINVLIGENGCGKSNILEAIAIIAAAAQNKLDNEFLVARGVRVTEPRFMRAAFEGTAANQTIRISSRPDDGAVFEYLLRFDDAFPHPQWQYAAADRTLPVDEILDFFSEKKARGEVTVSINELFIQRGGTLPGFLIYSPENSSLRVFQSEGQILPLGIKGEGLFAHLKILSTGDQIDRLREIMERLTLFDWFERFDIPADLSPGERSIRIRDRYLAEGALFDQRSANEGFLFLLFYFTLFVSSDTPSFFSIDNVDASLNPKLCSTLLVELVELAKKYDKQAILTTHNPAVLDGLDLQDDEQRLFVISRNQHGHTQARRVGPPKQLEGGRPVRLSEAFLRGYIGGLPKNF